MESNSNSTTPSTTTPSSPNLGDRSLPPPEKAELKEFDPVAEWTKVNAKGDPPGKRHGACSVLVGHYWYSYGGLDFHGSQQDTVFRDDMHRYDLEENVWTKINTEKKPKGRNFASIVHDADRNRLILFGGRGSGYFSDCWSFDLETEEWEYHRYTGKEIPSGRYGHTAVVYNGKMYVLGGYDSFGMICQELYEFSFVDYSWIRIVPSLGKLPELFHHTAVIYMGSMFVFGGSKQNPAELFEYRFSTRVWAAVSSVGKLPVARWGHRAIVDDKYMYVVSGVDLNSTICYGDLLKLDLETMQWERKIVKDMPARYFHNVCGYKHMLYVSFGLNTHNFSFDDIWKRPFEKFASNDTLFDDFSGMLNDKEWSDVTFEFPPEEGQETVKQIHAHKSILASRCSQFRTMFRMQMSENKLGKVRIEDASYTMFREFLLYLYTGFVPVGGDIQSIADLLILADRYLVDHLRSVCEKRLEKFVTIENVVSLHLMASQYNAPQLSEFTFRFMLKNYDTMVKQKKGEEIPSEIQSKMQKFLKL